MLGFELLGLLGRRSALGESIWTEMDLIQAVQDGLPLGVVESLIQAGPLTAQEVGRLVIGADAFARKQAAGESLSVEESDRLVRIARVLTLALETFQDREKAGRWLRKPNRAMDDVIPLDLLATETGAAVVQQTLHKIEHGVFA